MILLTEEKEIKRHKDKPLINMGMTLLYTPEWVMRMILIIEGTEAERNKGNPLINMSMTPLSTPESSMRSVPHNRRDRNRKK